MSIKEFFGQDEAEALQKASTRLRVPVAQLHFKRIPGVFSRALKEARVGICVEYEEGQGAADGPAPGEAIVAQVQGIQDQPDECAVVILEALLENLGMPGKVAAKSDPSTADAAAVQITLTVQFQGEHPDFRRGEYRELRSSIQYLINRMVNDGLCNYRARPGSGERRYIVDFSGNLEARAAELRGMSQLLARRVRELGRPVNVHLMESHDRRLLHLALVEDPDVASSSQGEGRFRILCIQPRGASGVRSVRPRREGAEEP